MYILYDQFLYVCVCVCIYAVPSWKCLHGGKLNLQIADILEVSIVEIPAALYTSAIAQFLISNGGSTNAFTSAEYTNYMFDVAQEYLSEALDR